MLVLVVLGCSGKVLTRTNHHSLPASLHFMSQFHYSGKPDDIVMRYLLHYSQVRHYSKTQSCSSEEPNLPLITIYRIYVWTKLWDKRRTAHDHHFTCFLPYVSECFSYFLSYCAPAVIRLKRNTDVYPLYLKVKIAGLCGWTQHHIKSC